jgi:hypothetical protein
LGTAKEFGNHGNITVGNLQEAGPSYAKGYGGPGVGLIDQVTFWRRELTSSEVAAQFNAVSPSSIPASFLSGTPPFFYWNLLLPVTAAKVLDSSSTSPLEISTGWLNSGFKLVDPPGGPGCTPKYFYRDGDTLVFEAPYNGAHNSGTGPRCELRGTTAQGGDHDWTPWGTHTLTATCVVNEAGDDPDNTTGTPTNDRKVIIGQIHSKSVGKPPVVLSYNFPNPGDVTVTVRYHPNGSDGDPGTPGVQPDKNYTLLTGVNLGEGNEINYTLQLVNDGSSIVLHTTVNEVEQPVPLTTTPYDADWANQTFYFKAGCYYPHGDSDPALAGTTKVTFSSLSVFNTPAVSIAVAPSTVIESGMDSATLTLTRDQTDEAIQVLLNFGGSATLGSDYTVSGLNMDRTVTMAIGVASVNLTITPIPDALDEGASEDVIVTVLPDPSGASYGPAVSPNHQATLTITDDD